MRPGSDSYLGIACRVRTAAKVSGAAESDLRVWKPSPVDLAPLPALEGAVMSCHLVGGTTGMQREATRSMQLRDGDR